MSLIKWFGRDDMRTGLCIRVSIVCGLVALGLSQHSLLLAALEPLADPASPGPCATSRITLKIGDTASVDVHYPSADVCGDIPAPFPGVVFAHGFGMFGLSDGAQENAGNGAHLASWGYIVAIPSLSDDFEARILDLGAVLDYLQSSATNAASPLYGRIDGSRLGAVGHSLGGSSVLALARRDSRIRAVVALDPVYHGGMPGSLEEVWNPQPDVPHIACPTLILGSPPSDCNANADYARIYSLLTVRPRASLLIVGASHCVFAVPGNSFCGLLCSGDTDVDKSGLSQRYMTAWLNEMLQMDGDYRHYLLSDQANQDVQDGLIVRQLDLVVALPRRAWLPAVRAR